MKIRHQFCIDEVVRRRGLHIAKHRWAGRKFDKDEDAAVRGYYRLIEERPGRLDQIADNLIRRQSVLISPFVAFKDVGINSWAEGLYVADMMNMNYFHYHGMYVEVGRVWLRVCKMY